MFRVFCNLVNLVELICLSIILSFIYFLVTGGFIWSAAWHFYVWGRNFLDWGKGTLIMTLRHPETGRPIEIKRWSHLEDMWGIICVWSMVGSNLFFWSCFLNQFQKAIGDLCLRLALGIFSSFFFAGLFFIFGVPGVRTCLEGLYMPLMYCLTKVLLYSIMHCEFTEL